MRDSPILFFTSHGSEYTKDIGYSHSMELIYQMPGESNAIEGDIIFEVPVSLTPDKTYGEIVFNSHESAVWHLG